MASLTQADLELIKAFVQEAVSEELKNHTLHCKFTVSESDAQQFSHLVGMMSDTGGGDLSKGIETMRKNHEWMKSMRERSSKAGSIFFVMLVTAVVASILSTWWAGIKTVATKFLAGP